MANASRERTVVRALIDKWIDDHKPGGDSKLAIKSGKSASTISKVRNGFVPKKEGTRIDIAEAMGFAEDKVFPKLTLRRGHAS